MIGRAVGMAFATARDFLARGLVRAGVTPNTLTLTGTGFTVAAGACYALGAGAHFAWSLAPVGANAWLLIAFGLLILSSACDMLDGAVARLGNLKTPFGAFLDSTMDRFSDFAIYGGIALYYARCQPANLTFVLLSMLAFLNAFLISYTRARAEDLIESCTVGYWQRGERSAAVLIASASYNMPALVVQQSLFPLMTVLRRMLHTRSVLAGRTPPKDIRDASWLVRIQPWRYRRMSWPYDLITIANIAWLIFLPIPAWDPLGKVIG